MNTLITRYEEIAMNAWPALENVLYDGWVLRFANGYTRRANSINPIYRSTMDVSAKLARCEEIYSQRGLRTIFKMTEAVFPGNLDHLLDGKGYAREAETSVQTVMLDSVEPKIDPRVDISSRADDLWFDAFFRTSRADVKYRSTLSSMLDKSIQPKCFARIRDGGSIVACGIGVLEEKVVGLFDIIVEERLRGRGLGRVITESILAWARNAGAEESYLQVMMDNNIARGLYHKLGYTEIYRYWYRVSRGP
ncbi:MAG: GNAT family N-acetyltransferase [candidate division WOR-3 bacterium]|nr:MAG: GNAT family N-acetyltransferase [candidate division WOR-3 bacterium]